MLASAASAAPTNANINVEVTANEGDSQFEDFDIDGDSVNDFRLEVNYFGGDGYGGYCGSIILS
jgi:hypothetical protein